MIATMDERRGASGTGTRPRSISRLLELPLLVVAAIVLSLAVRSNVAQAFYIPSG